MRQLLPYLLWLGHAGDARDMRRVLDAGIAALVDLTLEQPPLATHRELIYCRIPLEDGSGNDPERLRLALRAVVGLVRSRIPTLLFCGAGMSRTPAVAAAALALVTGEDREKCLARVREIGPTDVSTALWEDVTAAAEVLAGESRG
jgi:protein-tyrosine phosphatase